jgi:hypothetical protein
VISYADNFSFSGAATRGPTVILHASGKSISCTVNKVSGSKPRVDHVWCDLGASQPLTKFEQTQNYSIATDQQRSKYQTAYTACASCAPSQIVDAHYRLIRVLLIGENLFFGSP